MKTFFDSSAFAKRYIDENGSDSVEQLCAKARLATEVADAAIVNIVPSVVAYTIQVLETNAVRTLDALHVACALQWNAELFVSSDERQLRAAKRAGLQTKRV